MSVPNVDTLRRAKVNTCQPDGSNFRPGSDNSDYSVHKYDSVRLFMRAYLCRKSLLVFSFRIRTRVGVFEYNGVSAYL